ncbi:MAG: GDSL-type esterase/lipase family protein, partial [Candidatus Nanopelagicales bacterium]
MILRRALLAVGAVGAAAGGAVAYTVAQVQGRAAGDVAAYLSGPVAPRPPVVVAGASIVRGRASVDFVQMLRERYPRRTFVNGGVNGNVAWELLQRIDQVIACRPGQVAILIGTNDVQATLTPDATREARESKDLPEDPSIGWYAACMTEIVERLQRSGSSVAVCSLPPIGQDLDAPVNAVVREANAAIGGLCARTGAAYLPVYEGLTELLASQHATTGPAWTGSWAPGVRSLVEHYVFRRSF